MSERRTKQLQKLRWVLVAISCGIVILCLESLWMQQGIFKNYAIGLALSGTFLISVSVAWIVKKR